MRFALFLSVTLTGLFTHCKKNEKFPALGDTIAITRETIIKDRWLS